MLRIFYCFWKKNLAEKKSCLPLQSLTEKATQLNDRSIKEA